MSAPKKTMDIRSFFAKRPRPAGDSNSAPKKQAKTAGATHVKKKPISLDSEDETTGASSSTKPAGVNECAFGAVPTIPLRAFGVQILISDDLYSFTCFVCKVCLGKVPFMRDYSNSHSLHLSMPKRIKRKFPKMALAAKQTPTPASNSPEESQPKAASGKKKPKAKAKGSAKKKALEKPSPAAVLADPNNKFLDKTFVFTGVLDEVSREDAEEKVKGAGGRVTGSVSGKTDYLVVGSVLEDGRPPNESSKYRKAQTQMEKTGKPKILTEAEFIAMFGSGNIVAPTVDLVGNANAVKKITTWLRDWHDVVINGNKKPVKFGFKSGGSPPDNPNARAVLVSGPPGIGKTTCCQILARETGFVVLEYNASDSRTKKIVESIASGLTDSYVLQKGLKKCVIIMDEVYGMAGGDRGGNAALIQMVKKTKVPIFCICNDRMDPKIRNLAFSCYDIKFQL
eukprot:gene981-322_t